MTVAVYCQNKVGKPKERFETAKAARRAVALKRTFHNRRWPHAYLCPGCHGYHLTGACS